MQNTGQTQHQNEKYIKVLGCLRRRAALVDQPDRIVQAGIPDTTMLCNNAIQTSKYTYLTFLPKNLMLQLSKVPNMYFALIGACESIKAISFTHGIPFTYISLGIIMLITMVKDLLEDSKRRAEDLIDNQRIVHRFNKNLGGFEAVQSQTLRIGDLIRVSQDETLPADVVVLASSHPTGLCNVETKNLDGETNFKQIFAPSRLQKLYSLILNVREQQQIVLENDESPRNNQIILNAISNDQVLVPDMEQPTTAIPLPRVRFYYEKPCTYMYKFDGYFEVHGLKEQKQNCQTEKVKEAQPNKRTPIGQSNFIKKGSTLKNTANCLALVVYTGHDTKIMLNSLASRNKQSHVQELLNKQIIQLFIILLLTCLAASLGYSVIYKKHLEKKLSQILTNFEVKQHSFTPNFFSSIPRWLLMLAGVIPISLLVTMEIVKYCQGLMIQQDQNFCVIRPVIEGGKKRSKQSVLNLQLDKVGAQVHSSNLNEELGQVSYVITDKTGTLTSNCMRFRSMIAGCKLYGTVGAAGSAQPPSKDSSESESLDQESPVIADSNKDPILQEAQNAVRADLAAEQLQSGSANPSLFEALLCINLCHTVFAERQQKKIGSRLVYSAQSPDEYALLNFTRGVGFVFESCSEGIVEISSSFGKPLLKYRKLQTFDFTFTRKRMSVVVQDCESERIYLYSKGADQVMLQLLSQENLQAEHEKRKAINSVLKQYSEGGLRTLCLARKELQLSTYKDWQVRYRAVIASFDADKQARLESLQEELESCIELLGATGIEDALQERVGETLEDLRRAGIRVWMMTGDKLETAINIALSCNLLRRGAPLLILHDQSPEQLAQDIKDALASLNVLKNKNFRFDLDHSFENVQPYIEQQPAIADQQQFGLVVSGECFHRIYANLNVAHVSAEKKASAEILFRDFTSLLFAAQAVVGCRVTPREKQIFVALVKEHKPGAITLAIGDGANDVAMITEAHVGVGILGVEGREAAKASDFAIPEFRHLRRLLFYCGQECYRRNSELEKQPHRYKQNVQHPYYNQQNFFRMVLKALFDSFMLVVIAYFGVGQFQRHGYQYDIDMSATVILAICVIANNIVVWQIHRTDYFLTTLSQIVSIASFYLVFYIVNRIQSQDISETFKKMQRQPDTWLIIFLGVAYLCLGFTVRKQFYLWYLIERLTMLKNFQLKIFDQKHKKYQQQEQQKNNTLAAKHVHVLVNDSQRIKNPKKVSLIQKKQKIFDTIEINNVALGRKIPHTMHFLTRKMEINAEDSVFKEIYGMPRKMPSHQNFLYLSDFQIKHNEQLENNSSNNQEPQK